MAARTLREGLENVKKYEKKGIIVRLTHIDNKYGRELTGWKVVDTPDIDVEGMIVMSREVRSPQPEIKVKNVKKKCKSNTE